MSRLAEDITTSEEKDLFKRMVSMVDQEKVEIVKENLLRSPKGAIKSCMENYVYVLRTDPLLMGSLRFNLLNEQIDVVKKLWWNEEKCVMGNKGRNFLYYYFEKYYGLANEKNMDKALMFVANSNAYHPIQEYLEALEWDGQERIRYVLKKYMGADDAEYFPRVRTDALITSRPPSGGLFMLQRIHCRMFGRHISGKKSL